MASDGALIATSTSERLWNPLELSTGLLENTAGTSAKALTGQAE
jgi:hypothetical protein